MELFPVRKAVCLHQHFTHGFFNQLFVVGRIKTDIRDIAPFVVIINEHILHSEINAIGQQTIRWHIFYHAYYFQFGPSSCLLRGGGVSVSNSQSLHLWDAELSANSICRTKQLFCYTFGDDGLCSGLIIQCTKEGLHTKECQSRIANLCGHNVVVLVFADINGEFPLHHVMTHNIFNVIDILHKGFKCTNHVARPFLILGKATYLHSVDAFVVFYAMVVCLVELHLSSKEIKRSQSDAQSKHIEGIGQLVRSYLIQ